MQIIADHCWSLLITAYHWRSLQITEDHCWSLLITADHCWSLLITADHWRSLLITAYHWRSLLITEDHSWSLQITAVHCRLGRSRTKLSIKELFFSDSEVCLKTIHIIIIQIKIETNSLFVLEEKMVQRRDTSYNNVLKFVTKIARDLIWLLLRIRSPTKKYKIANTKNLYIRCKT